MTIIGDDESKGDETFIVLFHQPVNVTFAHPNPGTTRFMDAVVTIVDDDPAEDRSRVNQAPTFHEGSETIRELPENTAAGVTVGGPIAAADPDRDALTYSLSGNDSNAFDIDDATGQLLTRAGATYDYEAKSSYGLMVEGSDGQAAQPASA